MLYLLYLFWRTCGEILGPLPSKLVVLGDSDAELREKMYKMSHQVHQYELLVERLKVCLHFHEDMICHISELDSNQVNHSMIIRSASGHAFWQTISEMFILMVLGRIKRGKAKSKRRSRGLGTGNGWIKVSNNKITRGRVQKTRMCWTNIIAKNSWVGGWGICVWNVLLLFLFFPLFFFFNFVALDPHWSCFDVAWKRKVQRPWWWWTQQVYHCF